MKREFPFLCSRLVGELFVASNRRSKMYFFSFPLGTVEVLFEIICKCWMIEVIIVYGVSPGEMNLLYYWNSLEIFRTSVYELSNAYLNIERLL